MDKAWQTTRIALKWNCRTGHNKWKHVGEAILARGFEESTATAAGMQLISNHKHREHRATMEHCLMDDPILFWDLVYKYWRARGPHDGASRETIDLEGLTDDTA